VIKSSFSATGTVKPADFGMAKAAEFGLGPDIKLAVDIEAFKQWRLPSSGMAETSYSVPLLGGIPGQNARPVGTSRPWADRTER